MRRVLPVFIAFAVLLVGGMSAQDASAALQGRWVIMLRREAR